ncbi:phage tail tape measure protein [Acetatifactor muris]|uniref:Phage-related minor tail protein n=1 Tax=Acetatifactor muris TaxID=879566 RepID=A0A2K4ZP11_9FIRM|nr:phage tail tape measure protein [Acetatifactor muris]MCR2050653.1 phage tail tape measure protein [Acetatifactor muris]SOY32201.1 Phage-related minor tail protein [Acetatifactor muris]
MDNNDFILKIVAELEKKGIKTGYDKLKKELEKDPAKIDVILNTSGTFGRTKGSIKKLAAELHNELSVEISKLQKQGQNINFDLSVGDVEDVIQNVINHTKKLGESFDVASDKAQKFLAKFNKKSGGVLINSDEFKSVQEAINGLGNTHTIEDLNKAMNTLEVTYDNMSSKLRNSGKSFNPFINAKNEMATMDKTIEGISLEFDKLSSKPDDVANAIKELSIQQSKVNNFTVGTMEWADAYGHLQEMVRNVTKDISNLQKAQSSKSLQPKIDEIQLSMAGKNTKSKNYDYQIDTEIKKLKDLGFTDKEVAQKVKILTDAQAELKRVMDSNDFDSVASKNKAIVESDNERTIALNQVRTAYGQLKNDTSQYYNLNKQSKLSNDIQNWLSKNSRASKEAKESLNAYYRELSSGRVSVDRLEYIEKELNDLDTTQRGLGKLGKNLKDQFAEAGRSFTQWLSVSSAIMLGVSKTKEAISELIELDSILTEISKTSDLTNQQLRELGNTAFDSASKYGRSAADYLTGVQEMYRAGFKNAEEMAELSLLAQAAGDMEANSANDYLMATNAAYNYKGSVEELNKVLDSQNYITNNAAVSMQDMADATSEAASIASQYGVKIDELSALIAVATSKTRESGSEVGTALKSIFVTLQDTTSKPVIDAFESVGISMTKIVDGSERLKTPIELLKELSTVFNKLPEGDTKRANILTDIGKKYHANTLSAILSDWESYESMLDLYSQGIGSAAEEAEKSANNIEGSLNRLSNTWTDTVENIINSDAILTIVKSLNGLLSVINKITDNLGSLGTIGIGTGLFTGVRNVGGLKFREFYFINVFC